MGFLKPKAPAPTPVPSLDPSTVNPTEEDTGVTDQERKKRKKTGKSSLVVKRQGTIGTGVKAKTGGSGLTVSK